MIEAAPLERVVDLARAVGGTGHRDVLGADGADLGDGHLEVGEELEEERFQLLIGAVDLVDEEDGSAFVMASIACSSGRLRRNSSEKRSWRTAWRLSPPVASTVRR